MAALQAGTERPALGKMPLKRELAPNGGRTGSDETELKRASSSNKQTNTLWLATQGQSTNPERKKSPGGKKQNSSSSTTNQEQ